jgi:hypothetical protein
VLDLTEIANAFRRIISTNGPRKLHDRGAYLIKMGLTLA